MFGKIGATTLNSNGTNLKWHLSSSFHETEIILLKCLEKMVPQHSVAITLTKNHACQVILMKLKLNYSNVWKNWCHSIQITRNHFCQIRLMKLKLKCSIFWKKMVPHHSITITFNMKSHLSSYFDKIVQIIRKLAPQHSITMMLNQNDTCQLFWLKWNWVTQMIGKVNATIFNQIIELRAHYWIHCSYAQIIFTGSFASQAGVLNKNTTVRLDGARMPPISLIII